MGVNPRPVIALAKGTNRMIRHRVSVFQTEAQVNRLIEQASPGAGTGTRKNDGYNLSERSKRRKPRTFTILPRIITKLKKSKAWETNFSEVHVHTAQRFGVRISFIPYLLSVHL